MQAFSILSSSRALVALALALTMIAPTAAFGDDVTIVNPDTKPVPVRAMLPLDKPAEYPFQYTLEITFNPGQDAAVSVPFIPAATGRRVVIEHISFFAESHADENIAYGIQTSNSAAYKQHPLTLWAGTTGKTIFYPFDKYSGYSYTVGATPLRLYVGDNEPIIAWAKRSDPAGPSYGYMTITGHFESAAH